MHEGCDREQHNKQGSMEEDDKQLYQRPQMTGQARDEEDNQLYQRPQMTGQARDEEDNQL